MPRLLARAAVTAALLLGVVPGAASAAELEPLNPCYVSVDAARREPLNLAGSGFTPNAVVEIRVDGALAGTEQVDPTGAFGPLAAIAAPFQASGQRPFQVTVAEQGNPANVVTRSSRVTALRVGLRPAVARPSSRIRWSGRGFLAPGKVYAHYLFRGKIRRTVALGRPSGPCGVFSVRRRQFPFSPRTGSWIVQVDQDRAYHRRPRTNFVQLGIAVSRASG